MLMLLINDNREFVPQGANAPVGMTRGGMTRGMRWRLPFGRLCSCIEEGSP
jgi:hypothetical protein